MQEATNNAIAQLKVYRDVHNKGASVLDTLKLLGKDKVQAFVSSLTESQIKDLMYDINIVGRPDQILPEGDWNNVLYKPGRGWGKTFTGSHIVNSWAKKPNTRICIVAANSKELRDVIVKGESGILNTAHPDRMPTFIEGRNIVEWPNGSIALLYSAETPESLRGPQFHYCWIDELAKFRYQDELWDQVQFSLRLGSHPQCIITTTPRPTPLINTLIADKKKTIVVNGSIFENKTLSQGYLDKMLDKYGQTRLGLQELYGDVLNDNPNSLFQFDDIEDTRIKDLSKTDFKDLEGLLGSLDRIVVALDPAVTSNEKSDLTGIVVAGMTHNPKKGYVLADLSMKGSPDKWAQAAVKAYSKYEADLIIGEVNNGGDLIEYNLRTVDPSIPYKSVRATRGKVLRAEPISALYEQQKIHHVGTHTDLENQMLEFNPQISHQKSPDRMDALVWALTELMLKPVNRMRVGRIRFGT